ncbi:MAG: AMP-binding protein, partial [Rhodocyclaceae bacterium]|nr:AMP-binding protein [Rhodocyclaceae bacterium]
MTADLRFGDLARPGGEIEARAARLAGGLAALGVEDGDVVAVMLRNDPAYADLIQACRIAGCFYCQINWHFKADEAGFILADCGARVLIVHEDLLPGVAAAIPPGTTVIRVRPHAHVCAGYGIADRPVAGGIEYESWLAAQAPYAGPPRAPRGHMAYTSGTTGRPKGVRRLPVPAGALARQQALAAQLIREAFGIGPGARTLVS